jgi:PAS domain S-box-containing protein
MPSAGSRKTVLVLGTDPAASARQAASLSAAGFGSRVVDSPAAVLELLRREPPSALVADCRLGAGALRELLDAAGACVPRVPVAVTSAADCDAVLDALRLGAGVGRDGDSSEDLPAMVERVIRSVEGDDLRRRAGERYRRLLESQVDTVVSFGEDRLIRLFNPAAQKLFGRADSEVQGLPFTQLLPPAARARWDEEFRRFLETGRSAIVGASVDSLLLRPDGNTVPAAVTLSAVRESGEWLFVAVVRDISDRVTAIESLRAAQDRIAQAEKMRALGRMASGIAHDFNNALSGVIGYTELLLRRPDLPTDAAAMLRNIQGAAGDAAEVVRRMQSLARGGPGQRGRVDLNALAVELPELTRHRWRDQAQRSGVDIVVRVDPGGAPPVTADPDELREVLVGLIFNAVEAMPAGGEIVVRTGREDGCAFIAVSDNGTGMDERTRRRCFEPFFTTKGVESSGMGLALAWASAERHGGEVGVDSAPDRGTVVTVWLPAAEESARGPAAGAARADAPRSVLVVDDQSMVMDAVGRLVGALGYRVGTAAGGREAIRKFAAESYDVVITDLGMPDLDGREVAKALRQRRPEVPIILLTGWGDELKAAGEMPEGVTTLLCKPVTLERLRETLIRTAAPRA